MQFTCNYGKNTLSVSKTRTTEAQLKSIKIQKLPYKHGYDMKPSERASSLNSRYQNRKKRPKRSTNNVDMAEIAKSKKSEILYNPIKI